MTPRTGAVPATIVMLCAGVGISVQTAVNGHVNVDTGSPVLATAINHGSALVLAIVLALVLRSFPRARRQLRERRREIRGWWFLGGIMGLIGVLVIIAVTPALGVLVVGVAITLGQMAGSLLADGAGFGPGGRRPLNALRIAGVAVAVLAVAWGAFGRFAVEDAWVIPVVVAAGTLIAIQQAANGWLVVITGEFAVMSVINFAVSFFFVVIALVVAALVQPIDFAALQWWAPIGGIVGMIVGVASAISIRILGVLSVMLCIAAGQALGGIVLDLFFPVDATGLTAGAVIGAVLSVAAVGLAGLGGRRWRSAPEQPPQGVIS